MSARLCSGVDEVLAVVQDQEHLFVAQGIHECIGKGLAGCSGTPRVAATCLGYQLSFREPRQLHEPHPVRVGTDEVPGHLQG